ncbi:AI-2E family transporter [Flavobacterium sp. NST-5]|uniref:AI-2E family transporter n=1 Tax=Flavobacterium ichthyis TaxID=2698827 RepID=A0ABW9ZA27_9FLAO|nr:AI-2E family transporter [Flavobacterium ichthyis]NBL64970.1 AI-2E family transporter [Flavobacterium ichthyis]
MTTLKIPGYIKAVFISLLIIIIIFFMIMGKTILVPLMVSGYIAMLMTGFCNRLERWKIPRSLSAFIALLLISSFFLGFLYFVFSQLRSFSDDIEANMVDNVNQFAININNWVKNTLGKDLGMGNGFKMEKIIEMIESGDMSISDLLFRTVGTLSDVILLPVFIFFMLLYRDHFAVFVTKVFANERNRVLLAHIVSIRKIVHNYIVGAGKVMIILGIVLTLVLFTLGIKHAIFFGLIAGFLNIIPYLGPLLGAIFPVAYALLTKDSLFYPVAVAVSFTIVQLIEGSYLTPKITGANVNLNAFITFVGLLIGGAIWGIVGMILIIPTIAILKKLFELSPDTEPYAYLFGEERTQWFQNKKPLKSNQAEDN